MESHIIIQDQTAQVRKYYIAQCTGYDFPCIPIQILLLYILNSAAGVSEAKNRWEIKNPSNIFSDIACPCAEGLNIYSFAKTISTAAISTARIVKRMWLESSTANIFLCFFVLSVPMVLVCVEFICFLKEYNPLTVPLFVRSLPVFRR